MLMLTSTGLFLKKLVVDFTLNYQWGHRHLLMVFSLCFNFAVLTKRQFRSNATDSMPLVLAGNTVTDKQRVMCSTCYHSLPVLHTNLHQ